MGGKGSGRPEPAKRSGGGQYDKAGCFIATAVYGSPDANEVVTLRRFRDDVLCKSAFGKYFIAAYYRVSPSIAGLLTRSPRGKRAVRLLLNRIAEICERSQR